MNVLPERLSSDSELFADDTSLFSVVFDVQRSAADMNNDLKMISVWAGQWKISFNSDSCKQEVIFRRKTKNNYHH